MILGLPALYFVLILLFSFCAGMLGAVLVLCIDRKAKRKECKPQNYRHLNERSDWNRMARDEQLYNNR